jgi:hypothetical protein
MAQPDRTQAEGYPPPVCALQCSYESGVISGQEGFAGIMRLCGLVRQAVAMPTPEALLAQIQPAHTMPTCAEKPVPLAAKIREDGCEPNRLRDTI